MNKLPIKNVLKVLFDIKPLDNSGRVDVSKIYRVQPVVDLGNPSMRLPRHGSAQVRVNQKLAKLTKNPALGGVLADSSIVLETGLGINTSLSDPRIKSSINVDKSFVEPVKGFAPLKYGLPSPISRYATGSRKFYQKQNKNQNPEVEILDASSKNKPKSHFGASPAKLLEKYLNSKLSIKKELKAIGAKVEKNNIDARPRYRQIFVRQKFGNSRIETLNSKDDYQPILAEVNRKIRPAVEVAPRPIEPRSRSQSDLGTLAGEPRRIEPFENWSAPVAASPYFAKGFERAQPEIESWIRYTRTNTDNTQTVADSYKLISNFIKLPRLNLAARFNLKKLKSSNKRLLAYVLTGLLAFIIFTSFGQYGISVKNEVIKEGNSAVANLEQANENLRVFDFKSASDNFAEAYEEFSKAGESLNFMGASLTSVFAELPGAGKLKSAKNLVEAGKLLAEAGKSMSEAVSSLSQTGTILKLTTSDVRGTSDVQNIFNDLKKSLSVSSKNLSKAGALLSDVSTDALPEEKRESFSEFQSKLPGLEEVVSDAVEYTSFLENLLGSNGTTKKYVVLFQNNSELRPTGGFPGAYAVVTFKDGRLADFLVDDVYNLDGQLKENIIPPKPLQHITPNWGTRDANWFIDFPVSAQKAMEFFKKAAGYEVDGVLTMSPRMISEILKVVGPIEMPEYGLTINDENFLSTVQAEVEYGNNREQPKSIVKDMAPRLLEKINSSDTGRWLDIFNVFVSGLDKKDILMYFNDLNLQSFVVDKEFSGSVKDTDEDFLMVTFTNVKGSKTDAVTDNSISLNSKFETLNSKPVITHKLTITRQHNGGDSRYGFYNKQNPAYVRVLVPEGSELISISGNDIPSFRPLISYTGANFKQDNDLFGLESSFRFDDEKGVGIYKESGKTGFAFWLITDPGKQKTVELEYIVPVPSDNIYIQKQPGLEVDNFEFQVDDALLYNGDFDKDLEFVLKVDN